MSETDASGVSIGAMLTLYRDGHELPAAFYSQKLSPAESNCSVTELEGLAMVLAINHFAVYLCGVHFTVETDHKALSFRNSSRLLNDRLARCVIPLQNFDFMIRYRPGSKNLNADALSRLDPDISP